VRRISCRKFETRSQLLGALETKSGPRVWVSYVRPLSCDAFRAAARARMAPGLPCISGGNSFLGLARMPFQLKFGCVVLALMFGGASAAFAQSTASGSNGSAALSNSSAASASGSGSSNSSNGSNASNNSSARKVRTKIAPEYPALARQVNVTGKVKISAIVSADGRVLSTKIMGGSPLLTEAANTAVKQWRYEPSAKESTEIVEVDFSGK
jgi:TonB family protein